MRLLRGGVVGEGAGALLQSPRLDPLDRAAETRFITGLEERNREAAAAINSEIGGDLIYEDLNGDKIINALDQRPIGYAVGGSSYSNRHMIDSY